MTAAVTPDLDRLAINTIRFLSVDAVQKANSGHPGLGRWALRRWPTCCGRASSSTIPPDPRWFDRDRFVLSAGHGSMLLYSLLHLGGYGLTLEDIQSFPAMGQCRTPGHPESDLTPGVEATTGPLGQGISNAVGMAIAEAHLAARFNQPGHEVIDHHTYVLASDGDLMEGVASEACSGVTSHLGLGKLIVLYDDNHISLAGSTSVCFTEDVGARFAAYGWHVDHVADGNDLDGIEQAITNSRREGRGAAVDRDKGADRDRLRCPARGGHVEAHGSAHEAGGEGGQGGSRLADRDPPFYVPKEALAHLRRSLDDGKDRSRALERAHGGIRGRAFPELAAEAAAAHRGRAAGGLGGGAAALLDADEKGRESPRARRPRR